MSGVKSLKAGLLAGGGGFVGRTLTLSLKMLPAIGTLAKMTITGNRRWNSEINLAAGTNTSWDFA
jgi:hypothetical protein